VKILGIVLVQLYGQRKYAMIMKTGITTGGLE
jgi:hypothetical protein